VIYFDAAYIAKCYLNEPGAERVRQVAYGADGLGSCEATNLLKDFEQDEKDGVWHWFGVTSALIEAARDTVLRVPSRVVVRTGDALHLACAREHGFKDVYTNDNHMLKAAKYFQVTGVNVIASS
jgi:predicted nucleic acid-binding protein